MKETGLLFCPCSRLGHFALLLKVGPCALVGLCVSPSVAIHVKSGGLLEGDVGVRCERRAPTGAGKEGP